jgi:hypothetical protein
MWWSSLRSAVWLLPSCGVVWPWCCMVLHGHCLRAALRGSHLCAALRGGRVCGIGCPSSSCGVEWRSVRCGVADVFTRCCVAIVFAQHYAAIVFTQRCAAVIFAASRGSRLHVALCGGCLRAALRCGIFALPSDCHCVAVVFASPSGLLSVRCRLCRGHHRCRRSKGRGHLPSCAPQTGGGFLRSACSCLNGRAMPLHDSGANCVRAQTGAGRKHFLGKKGGHTSLLACDRGPREGARTFPRPAKGVKGGFGAAPFVCKRGWGVKGGPLRDHAPPVRAAPHSCTNRAPPAWPPFVHHCERHGGDRLPVGGWQVGLVPCRAA